MNMPLKPEQITGAYVSSEKYSNYDCQKLVAELNSVSRREVQLVIAQQQRYKTSQVQAFWLGYGQGDGIEASELSVMRGEIEALRKVIEEKRCGQSNTVTRTVYDVPQQTSGSQIGYTPQISTSIKQTKHPDAIPHDSAETTKHWKQAQYYQGTMRFELAHQEYLMALASCRTSETRDRIQRELQIVEMKIRSLR